MKDTLKKYAFPIIAGLIAFIAIAIVYSGSSSHASVLSAQKTKIEQLRGELSVKEVAAQQSKDANTKAATGVEAARKKTDDEKATALMKTALTWDSYATYSNARSALMSTYGLSADSDFLKTVLPPVVNRTDPSGKSYNVIDLQGLNTTFDSLESRVSMTKATDYSYFAVISARTKSKAGSAEVVSYYVAHYTVDANGKITDLKLDTVQGKPSTTG